jgi:hypothetical protein
MGGMPHRCALGLSRKEHLTCCHSEKVLDRQPETMREMHLAWRGSGPRRLELEVFEGLRFPLFSGGWHSILDWASRLVYIHPWIRISRSGSTYLGFFSTLTVWHHVLSRLGGNRPAGLFGVIQHCHHLFSSQASVVSLGCTESVSVGCVDQQSGLGDSWLIDRQRGSPAMKSRHFQTATRNSGRATS